jgi:nucleotide-binding universal stress UspA family protein
MYASILVPLDGSAFGEAALPAATAIGRRSGARLHIVHVRGTTTTMSGLPGLAAGWSPEAESAARSYLDGVADRTAEDLGESVSFALLDGPVPEGLRDYARAQGISLIVMSTHGRRGLSRAWLGSVAAGVIRDTPAPVLLVRPRKGGARPGPLLRISQVLVPLDGSILAEAIVAPAADLCKLVGAAMTLAHVVEPAFKVGEAILVPAVDQDPQAHAHMETEARGYVARIAAGTRATGLEVNEQVVSGEAVHSLLDLARELSVDLIALATHGRTGWQRLAFGSVADKIVRTSDIPMLVLRPHAETA